jgi:hypothetical protein
MAKPTTIVHFFWTPAQGPRIPVTYTVCYLVNATSITIGGISYTLGDSLSTAQFAQFLAAPGEWEYIIEK